MCLGGLSTLDAQRCQPYEALSTFFYASVSFVREQQSWDSELRPAPIPPHTGSLGKSKDQRRGQ